MASKSEKNQVFEREEAVLEAAKNFAGLEEVSAEELKTEFRNLTQSYGLLLGETKLLTSVSDRLQNKLNKANENIINRNAELEETIELLTKARAGRKATTIVFLIAVIIFLISEGFLDPHIEQYNGEFANSGLILFVIKLIMALALKPLEAVLEHLLMHRPDKKRV